MIVRQLALSLNLLIASLAPVHAVDWTTPAEAVHFKTTPGYANTRAYLERLAAAAPDKLKLTRFGVSPEGRDLMLVVAASGGEFTPEAAHASGKEIVLIQAGIHAGEIEGKDAGLMLLRNLVLDAQSAPSRTAPDKRLPHALDNDTAFAADPRARLEFFYRRSPWYAKQNIGAYPVVRLDAAALAAVHATP